MLTAFFLLFYSLLVLWVKFARKTKSKPAIVLGSGGHTGEMLRMLKASRKDFAEFTFWISENDALSASKIDEKCEKVIVPRPRKVGQSVVTSVLGLPKCMLVICMNLLQKWPSKIICNGPGLCFMITLAARFLRLLLIGSLPRVYVVYIESVARVRTLSLTGKLMRFFSDRFIVQWPELLPKCPPAQAECHLLV